MEAQTIIDILRHAVNVLEARLTAPAPEAPTPNERVWTELDTTRYARALEAIRRPSC